MDVQHLMTYDRFPGQLCTHTRFLVQHNGNAKAFPVTMGPQPSQIRNF